MSTPRTRGILRKFEALPDEIKVYFKHLPRLAEEFPWDVSIGYLFSLVELAHNMTIYCGVVKLHRVDCQRRSKNPPLAGVKVHHLGVVDAAHFMCSRTG